MHRSRSCGSSVLCVLPRARWTTSVFAVLSRTFKEDEGASRCKPQGQETGESLRGEPVGAGEIVSSKAEADEQD